MLLFVFGMFPHLFYDRFAALASGFMNAEPMAHEVKYMSLANLKGAAISIAVGVVVYFFIVRTWMMKKEAGEKVYVNRWPDWLDLENLIYRPLLLKWLPVVFGTNCRFFSDKDGILLFLRKTLYREKPTE